MTFGQRCRCCEAGFYCTCPGNVDLTVSGVVAEQCSVSDVNQVFGNVAAAGPAYTDPYVGSVSCSTTAALNPLSWFPSKYYDDDSSTCGYLSGANGAAIMKDSSGYLWVRIDCRWQKLDGFALRTWDYRDYYKSTSPLSSYQVGDTVNFSHVTTVKDGSNGGSYSDPGISQMPFDSSNATVTLLLNGCCHLCQDSTPLEYQVVLSGVANSFGCSNCPEFNGTYIVPFVDNCLWRLCVTFNPDPSCSGTTVQSMQIEITQGLGFFSTLTSQVEFELYTSQDCSTGLVTTPTFANSSSGIRTNCEYSSTSFGSVAMGSFCDWSSATCTLTAL